MVMISKLLRFGRRQVHTIVSRDTIKPSFPTPSHSKTYNLSVLDQLAINAYMPIVALYPSSNVYQSSHDKTLALKNSLSQTLTRYYPFAGRMKKNDPTFVDCNDKGVALIEACNTSSLSDFLQQSKHEDLNQLFPDDLICFKQNHECHSDENSSTCPLGVQVNHFACGGVAVAICLFHKIGDAISIFNFMKHWATITSQSRAGDHYASTINPHFISYQTRNINLSNSFSYPPPSDTEVRSFTFPNRNIRDLQSKVTAMTMESGEPIRNPSRVEVVTWLLHKCSLAAANKMKVGNLKRESGIIWPINLRNKLVEKLPETSIGNLIYPMIFQVNNNHGDLMPDDFIGEIRRGKLQIQNIPNLETALAIVAETSSENSIIDNSYYVYSSLCGLPLYNIDFGWGKPIKVHIKSIRNLAILMDTPDGNGIEALVCLEKQEMEMLLKDPELMAFC